MKILKPGFFFGLFTAFCSAQAAEMTDLEKMRQDFGDLTKILSNGDVPESLKRFTGQSASEQHELYKRVTGDLTVDVWTSMDLDKKDIDLGWPTRENAHYGLSIRHRRLELSAAIPRLCRQAEENRASPPYKRKTPPIYIGHWPIWSITQYENSGGKCSSGSKYWGSLRPHLVSFPIAAKGALVFAHRQAAFPSWLNVDHIAVAGFASFPKSEDRKGNGVKLGPESFVTQSEPEKCVKSSDKRIRTNAEAKAADCIITDPATGFRYPGRIKPPQYITVFKERRLKNAKHPSRDFSHIDYPGDEGRYRWGQNRIENWSEVDPAFKDRKIVIKTLDMGFDPNAQSNNLIWFFCRRYPSLKRAMRKPHVPFDRTGCAWRPEVVSAFKTDMDSLLIVPLDTQVLFEKYPRRYQQNMLRFYLLEREVLRLGQSDDVLNQILTGAYPLQYNYWVTFDPSAIVVPQVYARALHKSVWCDSFD